MVLKITGEEEVRRAPLMPVVKSDELPHTDGFNGSQGMKFHLALGNESPGPDILSTALSNGNSEDYRKLLADRDRIQKINRQTEVMSSIMQTDPSMITPELVNVAQGLSIMEMDSPDLASIIEEKYSKLYTNTAVASIENDVLEESMAADPEATMDMMDRAERVAFKQNYAKTIADSLQKENEDRSFASKAWDFGERIVPFVEWYQKQNAVEDQGDFISSVLPGSNLEEQYAYLWGLTDSREFKDTLDKTVAELKDRNLYVAQSWLEGFFSYGNSDGTLDNLLGVLDVATLVPAKVFGTALKGVARSASRAPTDLNRIASSLGKNADAAVGKSIEDIKAGDFFQQDIRNAKEVENSIPSIVSPDKLLVGADNIPQAAYTRMKIALLERADLAQRFLGDANLVDRATPEELVQYKDILLRDYVRNNPSIQKNVIDVEVSSNTDLGNVYPAKVVLGRRDGTLFESEKQAQNYFKRYIQGTDDYQIVQRGEGFQIEVNKSVDETKFLTDLKLGTTQRTPESLANTFGWWRSPNYTISREQELARSTAVTSTELLGDLFSEISRPFQQLSKKEFSQLEELMVVNRDSQKYFENYGEFETAFQARFKTLPSVEQADTYFAYVQINDLDLIVRDLDWYKQKARLGLEDITVKLNDPLPNGAVNPLDVSFEGKVVDRLPVGSKDPFSVSILENGVAKKPVNSRFLTTSEMDRIQKLLDKGYKIVQVADQAFKVGDRYAGFLVTDSLKRGRVGLKNIERKAGGHKVHKYPFYIKQGMISGTEDARLYRGDKTLFNIRSDKEGRELLEVLETARQKQLRGDPDAMKFVRDNLPISTREWAGSIADGAIDLNIPFALTKKGIRSLDTGAYAGLRNVTDLAQNEHNLTSKIMGRYGGERSEANINVIRSEGDNLFEIAPAPFLSPMDTLRSSSANMISTRVMNDYTLKTHQDFIREFSDILQGTREEQLSRGVSDLVNPQFKPGASPARQAAAKNVSRAYNNLMNFGTELDNKIEMYKEKLLSSILPKVGPRGQQWVEDKMLSRVKDPGQFFRSVAFNMKLGMFNVQQLFVQANSMVNVASIAGVNGIRGGSVYPIMRAALLSNSPEVIKGAGRMAEKVGLMKTEEFTESLELLRKSGFNNIGGDVAYLDDIQSPEIRAGALKQAGKKFLQYGRTPFQEGERMVRVAAWNAAYLERKGILKGAKITRRDEAMILQRAKDLTGNMTRESNAAWQKGYAAVATQFFGYQARIMEQFIGKKLTSAEKLKLFTGYSAVYGLPVAVGATTGVIPVRDILVDTMYGMGIDPDQSGFEPLIDGFAATAMEYITGTELSVADRYGPGGLPTFYDLWRGDKDISDIFLGASGSIVLTTIGDAAPFVKGMASEFTDYEGGLYNLTPDDFLAPLRNISVVDNAVKMYNVWNFGIWASKNGTDIMKMDLPEGIMAAMTGLQPASIEDAFSKLRATQDYKEGQKALQKQIIIEYRRVMKMEDSPEREKAIKNIKARMILGGMDLKTQAQTWKYAADQEMITDVFFENYDKLILRKKSREPK